MSLESYVKSFKIEVPSGPIVAGTPIRLVAAPTVPLLEVLTGPVSLQVLLKHVELPEDPAIKPFPPPATATNLLNVAAGLALSPEPSSIEGWLGSVVGTIPVGTRDISDQISITLAWRFFDANDDQLTDDQFGVIGGAVDAPAITITVPPVIVELTDIDFDDALATAETTQLGVQIVVSGTLGSETIPDVALPDPPLKLDIVAIPVPSVAALFNRQELTGPELLLLVPDDSPFSAASSGASSLMNVLTPLKALLDTVKLAAKTTAWATGTRGLHTAVTALTNRIPITKDIGFLARDDHKDLDEYDFIERFFWIPDDDLDDAASSALLVSATRGISFFENDKLKGAKLTLNATPKVDVAVDPPVFRFGGTVVRRLHVAVPKSTPPGCVSTDGTPKESGGTWGNIISSYEWGS